MILSALLGLPGWVKWGSIAVASLGVAATIAYGANRIDDLESQVSDAHNARDAAQANVTRLSDELVIQKDQALLAATRMEAALQAKKDAETLRAESRNTLKEIIYVEAEKDDDLASCLAMPLPADILLKLPK